MESYIVNSQIQEIKGNLIRLIQSQTATDPETKNFSKVITVAYLNNPDMICNIYGIKQAILLFDSLHTGLETIDMNLLEVETVIKIKEQLENFDKSKQFSRNL